MKKRGAKPQDPLFYKQLYHKLLMERIKDRIRGLENNDFVPEDFTVPGSLEILKHLNSLGVICFLASGTDQEYVFHEASLLGLNSYILIKYLVIY